MLGAKIAPYYLLEEKMPNVYVIIDYSFAHPGGDTGYNQQAVIAFRPYLNRLRYVSWFWSIGDGCQETHTIADAINYLSEQIKNYRDENQLSIPDITITELDEASFDDVPGYLSLVELDMI